MTSLSAERPPLNHSLKAFMAELVRAPSPDSACEQDEPWSPSVRAVDKNGSEQVVASGVAGEDTESEYSDGSNPAPAFNLHHSTRPSSVRIYQIPELHVHRRQVSTSNQDSDGDSGIDSVERFSQRIGSTSSTDTDPCQDVDRKSEHPNPLRVLPRSSPPRVHFDDGIHFSEQNMRRSCRQLLATLYAGRRADPRGTGRYRSFSMPLERTENTFSASSTKRLSVPVSPPENFITSSTMTSHPSVLAPRLSVPTSGMSTRPPSHTASSLTSNGVATNLVVCTPPEESHKADMHMLPVYQGSHDRVLVARTRPRVISDQVPFSSNGQLTRSTGVTSPLMSSQQCSKPKTSFPPKASPLSLPGSQCLTASTGGFGNGCPTLQRAGRKDVTCAFARPASVVPDRPPMSPLSPSDTARVAAVPSQYRSSIFVQPRSYASSPRVYRRSGDDELSLPRVVAAVERSCHRGILPPKMRSTENVSCFASRQYPSSGGIGPTLGTGGGPTTRVSSEKSISLPALSARHGTCLQEAEDLTGPPKVVKGGVEYAVVTRKNGALAPIPRITSTPCVMGGDAEPPLPPRNFMHKSDFALYRGPQSSCSLSTTSSTLSGSTSSLFERVQGMGRSARSALLRAFSTERIYRPQKTETAAVRVQLDQARSASATLVTGLKARMSLRRKSKRRSHQEASIQINTDSVSDPLWAGGQPTHVCGQLLQMNLDGSQVVELRRPHGRSFGFFLARGRVHAHQGVFVSRMHDTRTQQVLQGLLDIGDEILEVNGTDVRAADIMEVNSLMTNQNTLLLTVLPYICRKDI